MSETLRFDGRVAIVTGAGRERGLGEAHCRFLAERGARVVVNDVGGDATPAQRVVDVIRAEGGAAVANGDDVSSTAGAEAIVRTALDEYGRVDIVVNNAGIFTNGAWPEENDLGDFTRNFDVHLAGAFNVSRAAWPHFVSNRHGRIVNITSSAFLGRSSNAGVSYSAMKAGMIGFTRCLAAYGADNGIKTNAVAPFATTQMGTSVAKVLASGERVPLDPRLVSVGVALLVHESCPANGEIFGVGGGKVDRLFIGATPGFVDPDLTPELLLEHWDEVMGLDGFWLPAYGREHADALAQGTHEG
jgi:NAD(P)-dependent dehydrogenase (short-subunit alcohol dehydrogenase family)